MSKYGRKYLLRLVSVLCFTLLTAGVAIAQSCPKCPLGVSQLYSNADGSVQFLQIWQFAPAESHLAGKTLATGPRVAGDDGVEKSFTFPTTLEKLPNALILIATQAFADLGLVQPDFIVPNRFLPLRDGSVRIVDEEWYGGPVRYAELPHDGVSSLYPNVEGDAYARDIVDTAMAVNNAGDFYLFTPAAKLSGLWWSVGGSEPGWALAVEHQGETVFALWATHDHDGSPTWFGMQGKHWPLLRPGGAIGVSGGPNTYSGLMFRMMGPAFSAGAFDPYAVHPIEFGTVNFDFYPNEAVGGFRIEIPAVVQMGKSITPLVFATPVPVCVDGAAAGPVPNFQGMWWNPSESGWGLHLTHQGDVIFAIWFTYDATGKATWFTMAAGKTATNHYDGAIYRTTGPPYDAGIYDDSLPEIATQVGMGTLTFTDRENGTFVYAVETVQGEKKISRQTFSSATVCN